MTLNTMPMTDQTPLPQVARLCLSAGRLMLLTGANGRMVHEAIADIAHALGCDTVEVFCQHAAILVTIHRGSQSFIQMHKAPEHEHEHAPPPPAQHEEKHEGKKGKH